MNGTADTAPIDPSKTLCPLAEIHTVFETFDALLARGFWPIGIYPRGAKRKGKSDAEGKEPYGLKWGVKRWPLERFLEFLHEQPKGGLGVCLGPGRAPLGKWLIDVEGDGPEAEESRAKLFGGEIIETMGHSSVRGGHQFLTADGERLQPLVARLKGFELKDKKQPGVFKIPALPGLELRLGGFKPDGTVKQVQSVVPPTLGTDGTPRRWNGVEAVAEVPEAFYEVLEAIAAAADLQESGTNHQPGPEPPPKPEPDVWSIPFKVDSPQSRVVNYLRGALERASGRVAMAEENTRHDTLRDETYALAGYLGYNCGYDESELYSKMVKAGTRAEPERGDHPDTVRDAIAYGKAHPRKLPDDLHAIMIGSRGEGPSANGDPAGGGAGYGASASSNGQHAGPSAGSAPEPDPESGQSQRESNKPHDGDRKKSPNEYANLTRLEKGMFDPKEYDPEDAEHLWQDRVYRSKYVLFAGDGGEGKSQLAIRITAALTTGGNFPDGSGPAPTGHVFLLGAEDGMKDTIIPRLMAAGTDLSRVTILTAQITIRGKDGGLRIDPKSFQDLNYWIAVVEEFPDAIAFIADPIPAYLGRGANDHRNNDLRAIMEPFIKVLADRGIALIGITHTGKSTDSRTPMQRILGSVAYTNLARSVMITVRDAENPERILLCHPKNSLGKKQPTLAYKIVEHYIEHKGKKIRTSRLEFEDDPVDITADEAVAATRNAAKPRGRPAVASPKLAEWLFDLLQNAHGPMLWVKIRDAAGEEGHIGILNESGDWTKINCLYRAKDAIPKLPPPRDGNQVISYKEKNKWGKELTYWYMAMQDTEEDTDPPF